MSDPAIEKLEQYLAKDRERRERNRPCCKNCGWFAVQDGDDKVGECFRYPPAYVEGEWRCPTVIGDFHVCGEFMHKRTGDSFSGDAVRLGHLRGRVAELEEQLDRMKESQ